MALEILSADAAEDAGEATLDALLGLAVAGIQRQLADLGARASRSSSRPHHQGEAAALRRQEVQRAMDGGGAGSAGILEPGDRLEAQLGMLCRISASRGSPGW